MSNYFEWKKGEKIQLSKNFNSSEFSCKCKNSSCINQKISKQLIESLQKLRDERYGAIIITSAYRCEKHNKAVGGSTKSQHLLGNAVDIKPGGGQLSLNPNNDMDVLRNEARKHFNGIGIHNKFVHCDIRSKKTEWKY